MIPRTSRTGTLRAAPAACAAVPSAIGLPLLLCAFLAVLWLLCAAPAQADTSAPGSGPLGTPVSEAASATGEALGLDRAPSLDTVVPGEVTEPVTATLGTVHQRLERRTTEAAEAAVALPEPAVAEVRGFVAEIDRTREETVDGGLVRALPVSEDRAPRTAVTDADAPEETGEDRGSEEDRAAADPERPAQPDALLFAPAAVQQATPGAGEGHGGAEPDDADRFPEHQRVQPATGSPAPTSNGPAPVPSVAGYLSAAPLPAPAADAVLLAAHRLHTVPADPADDPTVSPD
ncbi:MULTISPECIES: hypothetical protein [unclassified Nocardiopsis]|uniref:hypothetical protein n=1 Tax=unclassified Nocardiopsis TaxID=2649073 RepID=UPI0033FE85CB